MDISRTAEADSTQINADDLVAPRTVTITGVSKGTAEQPVNLEVDEFQGRVYRPCKSMRRVLIQAWGSDASIYIGRRLTLFNDPSVKWGGQAVGGVRIKAMSHIDKKLTLALTVTRGQKKPYVVEPLPDTPTAVPSSAPTITDDMATEFERDIANAATLEELDAVAADLKAYDLGAHKQRLQTLGRDRRAALKSQPTPEDRPSE